MDTILFDLDGTLLPMDQKRFLDLYIPALCKKLAGYGFEAKPVVDALWGGTHAMAKNDGSMTNEQRFWDHFSSKLGSRVLEMKEVLEQFYEQEFNAAQPATGPNPLAVDLVRRLKQKGHALVLASNPVFPACAYATRLGWLGLGLDDFDYFTSYEHCRYCKPNPAYFGAILKQIGKNPEDCLMVGNDLQEDGCCTELGIPFYLVTDNLLNEAGASYEQLQHGSFSQLYSWMEDTYLR